MATFSVVSNIGAANATANLSTSNLGLQKAIQRLSSGLRINMSGDDAAGLAVANSYRSAQAVLTQGVRNAGDGLSTLQIQDGALNNISTLLDRLSTLATQSASGGFTGDRAVLDSEFQAVLGEIDREASVVGLDADQPFSVFVSNNGTDGVISGTITAADTATLNIDSLSVADATSAASAVTAVTTAIGDLGTVQAQVGILENRMQFAISLAQSQIVNNKAAESRIRDANVAEESANLTKYSILNQSGIAALAQANQQSAAVLSLLR